MHFDLGLKEQNVVCESLGRGLQVFAPRKGGLEDFTDGNRTLITPDRPFLLLPSRFHQDLDQIRDGFRERLGEHLPNKQEGLFVARYAATIDHEVTLAEPAAIDRIASEQAFVNSVLQERFAYRTPGLKLLVLRVFQLSNAVTVPDDARTAGCKSWIELPQAESCEAIPVLSDDQFSTRCDAIASALSIATESQPPIVAGTAQARG